MDKDNIEVKEIDYEKMVDDAFQHLIDTYLASRHRRRLISLPRLSTLHDKRIRVCADSRANLISCTLLPLPKLLVKRWDSEQRVSVQPSYMMS